MGESTSSVVGWGRERVCGSNCARAFVIKWDRASSVVYPSCQQTHHITSSGCKPYYYAFQANHTTIVMPSRSIRPNPSFESILCILKSWTRGFSCNRLSIKVRRISPPCTCTCTLQSQRCKSHILHSVSVLWHSLTTPDRCVAASPQETSSFRFR